MSEAVFEHQGVGDLAQPLVDGREVPLEGPGGRIRLCFPLALGQGEGGDQAADHVVSLALDDEVSV